MGFSPAVEIWRSVIEQYAGDLPVEFLLAWIQRESAGNPCSYTSMHESGIFQLMPPDNTDQGGTSEAALRTACIGSSQQMSHALTDAEIQEQVVSGIRYVNYVRAVAHHKLDAAGVNWPETSADFWKVVKLQHAYPGPTAGWLASRPATWADMRSNISGYSSVLDNAEWVGAYGEGGGSSLGGWGSAILGVAIAAALWYGWHWWQKGHPQAQLFGTRHYRQQPRSRRLAA
jgi:hypothetical protein